MNQMDGRFATPCMWRLLFFFGGAAPQFLAINANHSALRKFDVHCRPIDEACFEHSIINHRNYPIYCVMRRNTVLVGQIFAQPIEFLFPKINYLIPFLKTTQHSTGSQKQNFNEWIQLTAVNSRVFDRAKGFQQIAQPILRTSHHKLFLPER